MNWKYFTGYLLALILALMCTFGMVRMHQTKIVYVRTQDLMLGYQGTKEAMSKFSNQKVQWQANLDTLKFNFEKELNNYKASYKSFNTKERSERENKLSKQEQQLQRYREAITKKVQEEDQKLLEGIVNQINSYVASYGKQNGYDVILGTNSDGNLMYAKESLDITEVILEAMNKNYLGE